MELLAYQNVFPQAITVRPFTESSVLNQRSGGEDSPANHPVIVLQVLCSWLSNSPNYEEITKWYLGWKSMFSDQVLAHPSIKDKFNEALDIMNRAVSSSVGRCLMAMAPLTMTVAWQGWLLVSRAVGSALQLPRPANSKRFFSCCV